MYDVVEDVAGSEALLLERLEVEERLLGGRALNLEVERTHVPLEAVARLFGVAWRVPRSRPHSHPELERSWCARVRVDARECADTRV